ncbi:FAD/NAD-P-binding domain-containing protein [Daedaleopsis nitida]|nr:FAD/NAD-P-binding domain-containing protein [Daedaleopsis nitida]
MSYSSNFRPQQCGLPISFVIIGGGIAGLACALALRRVGHRVLVLEKSDKKSARGEGGIRLPPNLTKIFFHWGLRDALKKKAVVSRTIVFSKYESGDYLGSQVWDENVLAETRGVFMLMTHEQLHEILHDAAIKAGVQVKYKCPVTAVDPANHRISLASGETLSADVVVGADGEYGLCRRIVVGQEVRGTPTGLAMYDTIVNSKYLPKNLAAVKKENGVFVAFGDNRSIVAFPVRGSKELAFQFYGPDDAQEGRYGDAPSVKVQEIATTLDERLQPIIKNARKAVRVTVREYSDIEDWVEDDGRLVLIGEAAHPFPPGTIQATAMAVEDGAVLAKLFSHLAEERQIESFLYAFQDLRQARTREVRASEFGNAFFMAMPDCDASRQRDAGMRQLGEQGVNVLEGGGEASGAFEEVRTIFGYDCEDEADDWWVQWGLLRERAIGRQAEEEEEEEEDVAPQTPMYDFSGSAFTVQVSSA